MGAETSRADLIRPQHSCTRRRPHEATGTRRQSPGRSVRSAYVRATIPDYAPFGPVLDITKRLPAKLDVGRKGCRASAEKRSERHEASEEQRNVRLYMSSDERRFVARSSFSARLKLPRSVPQGSQAPNTHVPARFRGARLRAMHLPVDSSLIVATVALLLACCCGCASSKHASASPNTYATDETSTTAESATSPRTPALPSCEDGTCFSCGDGICPSGFYCETNATTTGCAWHPSCPKNPTCTCLRSAILKDPSCACEDRNGTAFVTCRK